MNALQQTISREPVSNFQRVAKHENFVIQPDLNMVQQVRVVTLDENGVPMLERIAQDETMTSAQKHLASIRYQDQIVTKATAGAYVDPATGDVASEAGEGLVPQRDYFQAITLGQLKALGITINDDTQVAQLIYTLMANEIRNIDLRGEL